MKRAFGCSAQVAAVMMIAVLLYLMLYPGDPFADRQSRRDMTGRNIRTLVLAMHNYYDQFGHLPPAYVTDEDGKPMHSWRVFILPYIGEEELYERYDFDQPWDGPDNIKLLDEMPAVFRAPGVVRKHWWYGWDYLEEHGSTYTQIAAITGQQTIFEDDKSVFFEDICDGMSTTVVLSQCPDNCILWTEPVDLSAADWLALFESRRGKLQVHDEFPFQGLTVAFSDCSIHFLSWKTGKQTLRALSTKSAGDKPGKY